MERGLSGRKSWPYNNKNTTNTLLIPPQGTKVNFESPSQVLLPTQAYVTTHLLPNKHKTKEKRKNT